MSIEIPHGSALLHGQNGCDLPQYDLPTNQRPFFDLVVGDQHLLDYYGKSSDDHLHGYLWANDYALGEAGRKLEPTHSTSKGDYARGLTVVTVPIYVATETPESVVPTFESIRAAKASVDGPVVIMPWLNWASPPNLRRQANEAEALRQRANAIGIAICDLFTPEDNVALAIGKDTAPSMEDQFIARVRRTAAFAESALVRNLLERRYKTGQDSQRQRAFHDSIHFQVDIDTIIPPDFLSIGQDTLRRDSSLFVSAKLHYIGGVMEKTPAEVSQEPQSLQLLYLVEHMRRTMFDHLPASARHGYITEAALGMKLGTLLNLGNFREDTVDDESWHLWTAALKALDVWYDLSEYQRINLPRNKNNEPRPQPLEKPYISPYLARSLISIAHYPSSIATTAIDNIQELVMSVGPRALINFDQGSHYTLRSYMPAEKPQHTWEQLSADAMHSLLNQAYSYFASANCGGLFLAEDLRPFNELMRAVLEPTLGSALDTWIPRFIETDINKPARLPKANSPA